MTAGFDVATYLASQNLGTFGTNLFVGLLPESAPDDAMLVSEYGGMLGAQVLDNPMAYEMPRLQILARSASYETARNNAQAAYLALGTVRNAALSGSRYLSITPQQPPFLILRDDNNRTEIGFNVEIEKEV